VDNSRPLNSFLKALSLASYHALSEQLVQVDLVAGACLQDDEAPVDWVYFPVSGLLSLVLAIETGESIETSMIGVDGAAGLIEACASQLSHVSCVVHIGGRGWRAPASAVRHLMLSDPGFCLQVWRFAELQVLEARQAAICLALHSAEHRLARRLLESQDRAGWRGPMPMTQESVATLLSVQRTTVTAYANVFQQLGLIAYKRGQVEILDYPALEAKACICRKVIQKHHDVLGITDPYSLSPAED